MIQRYTVEDLMGVPNGKGFMKVTDLLKWIDDKIDGLEDKKGKIGMTLFQLYQAQIDLLHKLKKELEDK